MTIVTGDRDAFQLIDPESRVRVMATSRGITDTKTYDYAAVVERYGIPPELIPDFYGLKGDTSDNIPGVPGIGDKTASQLLQSYGTLEEVLEHVDDISGAKRKENLREHAEDARVSKVLATIQRDVPVDVDPLHEAGREPDRSRLREVFREFELRDPLRRLEEALGSAEAAAPAPVAETTVAARVREGSLRDARGARPGDGRLALAVRAPEVPRGRAARRTRRAGASPWPPARDVLAGTAARPEDVVAALGDAAGGRPRRQGARRSSPRGSPTTRCSPPSCSSPPAAASRSGRSREERGLATDAEDPTAADAILVGALAALAARAARASAAWSRSSTTSSCRSCTSCATWSVPACG